ncbi:unnamed protein product [Brassica oleracea]
MCYLIIRQIHPRRLLRRQSEVPVSPSVPAPRRRARRFTTLRRWDQKRMRASEYGTHKVLAFKI